MSIVGPRPLAVIYLDYYNDEEKKRHKSCASEISKWENLGSAFVKQIRRRNAQLLIDEVKEISIYRCD